MDCVNHTQIMLAFFGVAIVAILTALAACTFYAEKDFWYKKYCAEKDSAQNMVLLCGSLRGKLKELSVELKAAPETPPMHMRGGNAKDTL
jgi:hypothetical protein